MTNTIRIDGIVMNVQAPEVIALAQRIYEDRQAGRPTPRLECTEEHRGEMYLQPRKHSTFGVRLWAMHNPGQGHGCSGVRFSNEGPGHRAAKAYVVEAWERHGYATATEHSTGPTRLDAAVINAPAQIGFEAQFSPIKPEAARGRTTKSYNVGWTALWLPGRHDMALAQYHGIPMARPHTDIAWADGTPKPGTVHVLSKRPFVMARCRDAFDRCPETGRGVCDKHHPFFPPYDDGFDVLDEVLGELAAGLTVPLMDAKGHVRLVSADDYRRYEESTGLSGEYRAASDRPTPVTPTVRNIPCTADRTPEPPIVTAPTALSSVQNQTLDNPRATLTITRATATFSPADPDFFTKEPRWALKFGAYYPLLVALLKDTVPAHARDWDAKAMTWFINGDYADELDAALRARNCAVTGLTAPPRPPIPVHDVWSAAAERDRQFGEANRARIRQQRLDAHGFIIREDGGAA